VHSRSAISVNRATGGAGQVWQGAFHDRALRPGDEWQAMARYLVANPVRAGIVARLGDYPFWDAIWAGQAGDPMELLL
jgi:putative transposase